VQTTISQAEENACDHLGHAVYRERGEKDSESEMTPESGATPLLLEKNQGEQRTGRPGPGEAPAPGGFIKVSPKNAVVQSTPVVREDVERFFESGSISKKS
jgi:hypothetical protein